MTPAVRDADRHGAGLDAALDAMIVDVPVVRDQDGPDLAHTLAARVRFLDRTCALGHLVLRRDAWPIAEIGASVDVDGYWRVRIQTLSIDRDKRGAGRSESVHYSDDCGRIVGYPLRLSLTVAVQKALLEHFAHEVAELLYYRGKRIIDPHTGDIDGAAFEETRRP